MSAQAHIRLLAPTPRSQNDNLKTGPCGGVPKGEAQTRYAPGQQLQVQIAETIGHRGCFQIALSSDDDQSFALLAQVDDPADGTGTRVVDVTLPEDVLCNNCTLQARQLMIGRACQPNQDIGALGAGAVYYSCADIEIRADDVGGSSSGDAGGSSGAPTASSSSGAVGGSSGAPAASSSGDAAASGSSSGEVHYLGPMLAHPEEEEGGCAAGGAAPGAAGLWLALWVFLRRRQRTA